MTKLLTFSKPSLLIFRADKKLLLEVTGIESPQRSNQLGRKVLNSIVWIVDDLEENEGVIRQIAYSALQSFLQKDNSFSEMIQCSIAFHGLEEFRVSLEKVNNFVNQLERVQNQQFSRTELLQEYQIQHKLTKNIEDLAEKLRNYCLPKKWSSLNGIKTTGVLVVVTDNLEQQTILHEAGVWRGFASNAEAPIMEEATIREKKTKIPEEVLPLKELQTSLQSNQKTRQSNLFQLKIAFLAGTIAILLLVASIKLHQPQPKQIIKSQHQSKRTFQPHPQPVPIFKHQPQLEQTLLPQPLL